MSKLHILRNAKMNLTIYRCPNCSIMRTGRGKISFLLMLLLISGCASVHAAKTKTKTTAKKIDTSRYNNICGTDKRALDKRGHAILKNLLSLSGSAALELKSSPQHKAMCWIILDDPRSLGSGSSKKLRQRYSAAVLYYATGGSGWKRKDTWLTKSHECTWTGITCSWPDHNIVGIDLAYNNLTGVLPREIGALSYLKTLEMYANELSGIIPASIGNLTKLQVLKLQINALIGAIPPEIGNCKSLVQLVLYANYLNGKLPESIGKLSNLELLDVFANSLSGLPPKSMAQMKKLEEVYINHNDMGGRIPKLDRSKAKGKNKAEYENICSLKQLKVLQADCLSVKGYPAEIQCDCCTVCCNDNTDPQCIPVTRTKSTSTKKK